MLDLLPQIAPVAWSLLAGSAVLLGIAKTALPGISTISVAVFAAILPARESTAALLLLLMLGDVIAIWAYRKHAHWPTIVRLLPGVALGIALGAVVLGLGSDTVVKRVIGGVLLLLIAFTLWRRRAATPATTQQSGVAAKLGYGTLGGFTTTVANAGGPVISLYLLASNFPVQAFLGTAAWFFAILNLTKLPISIGLGLVTPSMISVAVVLAPAVIVGALLGKWVTSRISQRIFEIAIIALTLLGALYLLIS